MRKSDPNLTGVTRAWHGAYCRWYDHDKAGNRIRGHAWGWIADRLANHA